MRAVRYWTRFSRDVKLMGKRGRNLPKLKAVTDDLIHGRPLSPLRRDHPLTGEWAGFRDCHVEGDWVLIYRIDAIPEKARKLGTPEESVTFARTGTHADLLE